MRRVLIVAAGLGVAALAGCASSAPAARSGPADGPVRLGAGDSLGMNLHRTDHEIARVKSREPTLAAHPD